jgi:hypothetical protein
LPNKRRQELHLVLVKVLADPHSLAVTSANSM